jgi:hypothetical protein
MLKNIGSHTGPGCKTMTNRMPLVAGQPEIDAAETVIGNGLADGDNHL